MILFTASPFAFLINVLNAMEVGLSLGLLSMVHLVQLSLLNADWDLIRFGPLWGDPLLPFLGIIPSKLSFLFTPHGVGMCVLELSLYFTHCILKSVSFK